MDNLLPNVWPVPQSRFDADAAARRIAQLEGMLFRRDMDLDEVQAALDAIHASTAFRLFRFVEKLGERFIPLHSRRRLLACTLLNIGFRMCRRVTGKNLAQITAYDRRDRLTNDDARYARWIRKYEPTPAQIRRQRRAKLDCRPKIGLVLSVPASADRGLDDTLQSVLAQTYADWELWIVGGQGTAETIRIGGLDARVRMVSTLASEALTASGVEFVARLHAGDRLAPFALFAVAQALTGQPAADFVYSDEDEIDAAGRRSNPRFKPDWSPDTLLSHNYIGRLALFRRELLERLGDLESSTDYELALRAGEFAKSVVHIPQVLCHTRPRVESAEAQGRALARHLERANTPADIEPGTRPDTLRVRYRLQRQPLISVLIPNRDSVPLLSRCLDALAKTRYSQVEVLILENLSMQPETHAYYDWLRRQGRVRTIAWDRPFNYAAVNNFGATHARGELLLFLNNDVEAITPDWLECLAGHALRPEVGAVGAKLYYADDTVQHAGVIVGLGGAAGHGHLRFPRDADGYMGRLQVTHNCSVVTGACLMMRAAVFAEIGGFDERFVLAYNDVDLCLQILKHGYRVVWTPDAELYHYESKTRGTEDTPQKLARFQREYRLLATKWADFLKAGDPYYSPNLSLGRTDFAIRD